MKKATILSWLYIKPVILLLLLFLTGEAINAQEVRCFGITDTSSNSQSQNSTNATSGSTCLSDNIANNSNRYKLQERFIPNATDPVKTVEIKFIVVQNSSTPGQAGNFENNAADLEFLDSLVSKVNMLFGNISSPLNPQTCVCGTDCHIPDVRFRVEQATSPDFIVNSSLYGSRSFTELEQNAASNEDEVLNVFLVSGNFGTGGRVNEIANYKNLDIFQAIVAQNYYSAYQSASSLEWCAISLANNLMHEIGHVFGLLHVYESTCCNEFSSQIYSFDFLEDFWGSGTTQCPQIDMPYEDWCCGTPDDTCSLNWVGGFCGSDHREATPMQIGRVHRATKLSSARRFIKENTNLEPDHIVSYDETWEFSIRMYSNIVVKSGATLTLKCEVFMPPAGNIYVEPGAELIVDGGTITTFDDEYLWGGIQVEGDATKSQIEDNGVQYQGKATFKNDALIENARHAVTNWKVNDWTSMGGIIDAENTTFRNNLRSIEFMAYENYTPSNPSNIIRNISSFKYCTFEQTEALNTGENPIAMVTLWQVRPMLHGTRR